MISFELPNQQFSNLMLHHLTSAVVSVSFWAASWIGRGVGTHYLAPPNSSFDFFVFFLRVYNRHCLLQKEGAN